MSIFGGLTGLIKGIGGAVQGTWATIKGDKSAKDKAIHEEQIAILDQFAKEFVTRPQATWWDSLVDGLNRLPRPVITFSIFGIFVYAFYDPYGFVLYMQAFNVVPDELWFMWTSIIAFWFGSRIISEDIRKPRVTPQQIETAKALLQERERIAEKATTPTQQSQQPPTAQKAPIPILPRQEQKQPEVPRDVSGALAIDAMIADLIRREGGYVNDPDDSGGPTKYGITQAALEDWLDRDCTENDVKALTENEAAEIYRAIYYFLPRIDALPASLQAHVFDIGVNSGPRAAIKMLQRALNSLLCHVNEDGIIGPQTIAAVRTQPPSKINNALVEIRRKFYESIVADNPEKQKFMKGWCSRADLFLEEGVT